MARNAAALADFLARTPFFGGLDGEALRRIVGMTVQALLAAGGWVISLAALQLCAAAAIAGFLLLRRAPAAPDRGALRS